ncbi:MAG: hypothetical protein K1X83_15075 [Oligoflexia bacterium]|nr:hypothetical protein [Oligoflexia bacterium]
MKKVITVLLISLFLSGCNSMSQVLNPFYETPPPVAKLGELNDHALRGDVENNDKAREALTQMASYQRAHDPQPVNPVMQPAVVRLMWVPDHLNRNGDLVPAHYYYLKVLSERWAVQDAFELEAQLNGPNGTKNLDSGNLPFVYENEVKGH